MALNLSLRQGIYLLNRDTAVIIWGASFRGGVGLVHISNYAKCLNRSKKKHFHTKKCSHHQDKTSFVVWETTVYAAFSSLYTRFLSAACPVNSFFFNLCCGSSPFVFPTEEILRKKNNQKKKKSMCSLFHILKHKEWKVHMFFWKEDYSTSNESSCTHGQQLAHVSVECLELRKS